MMIKEWLNFNFANLKNVNSWINSSTKLPIKAFYYCRIYDDNKAIFIRSYMDNIQEMLENDMFDVMEGWLYVHNNSKIGEHFSFIWRSFKNLSNLLKKYDIGCIYTLCRRNALYTEIVGFSSSFKNQEMLTAYKEQPHIFKNLRNDFVSKHQDLIAKANLIAFDLSKVNANLNFEFLGNKRHLLLEEVRTLFSKEDRLFLDAIYGGVDFKDIPKQFSISNEVVFSTFSSLRDKTGCESIAELISNWDVITKSY